MLILWMRNGVARFSSVRAVILDPISLIRERPSLPHTPVVSTATGTYYVVCTCVVLLMVGVEMKWIRIFKHPSNPNPNHLNPIHKKFSAKKSILSNPFTSATKNIQSIQSILIKLHFIQFTSVYVAKTSIHPIHLRNNPYRNSQPKTANSNSRKI